MFIFGAVLTVCRVIPCDSGGTYLCSDMATSPGFVLVLFGGQKCLGRVGGECARVESVGRVQRGAHTCCCNVPTFSPSLLLCVSRMYFGNKIGLRRDEAVWTPETRRQALLHTQR